MCKERVCPPQRAWMVNPAEGSTPKSELWSSGFAEKLEPVLPAMAGSACHRR